MKDILEKASGVDLLLIEAESERAITGCNKITIAYINHHICNQLYKNSDLLTKFYKFNYIHSDGIGVFLATKFLLTNAGSKRFNWSDNASKYLEYCEEKGYSIYFIGSTTEVITRAVTNIRNSFPGLEIKGWNNGFEELNDAAVNKVNRLKPNILWVGAGSPRQELWIIENCDKLDCNVIQAVGDIFSLFAGVKKRGPLIIQWLGFEWLVRVLYNPKRYFKRYMIGIPQFLYIILREKLSQ